MGVRPMPKDRSQHRVMMTFALRPVTRLLYLRKLHKLGVFVLVHQRNIWFTAARSQNRTHPTHTMARLALLLFFFFLFISRTLDNRKQQIHNSWTTVHLRTQ